MSTEILDKAIEYTKMGISVIPLLPNSKQPHFQRLTESGYVDEQGNPAWQMAQTQIATEDILKKWFLPNNAGIALVGGKISNNLIYLDFDDPDSYKSWALSHKPLVNSTAVQKTANGYHVFLRCDKTKGGKLHWQNKPVGEVRGDGMYVVCPPSIHPEGVPYQWLRLPRDGIASIKDLSEIDIISPFISTPTPYTGFRGPENKIATARKLLRRLDPWRCDDYDSWLRVGMALTSLGDAGLELWHEWSAQNTKYNAGAVDKKWMSFKRGDGLGFGSLHFWANQDSGKQQAKWRQL